MAAGQFYRRASAIRCEWCPFWGTSGSSSRVSWLVCWCSSSLRTCHPVPLNVANLALDQFRQVGVKVIGWPANDEFE